MDLRILRAHLRMPQRELAKRLGLDQRRLSEVELGERNLTTEQLARLAELLDERLPGALAGEAEGAR